MLKVFGGSERIRTDVGAFAELSPATRPRNLIQSISKFPFANLTPIPIGALSHGTIFFTQR